MQPQYYKCQVKINARAENAAIYRSITGNHSIPVDGQYWTLCNEQPVVSGAEIVQLTEMGLFKKEQFHGVDRDKDIIERNKKLHPEAHWYHGEWVDIIQNENNFEPDLIYLDATNFSLLSTAATLVSKTMYLCKKGCLLLANLMLSDPYGGKTWDIKTLVRNVEKNVVPRELKKWNSKIPNYIYNATGKTSMVTYVLFKEKE